MKKAIYDFLYRYLPRLWFVMKYDIENEYQYYAYSKDEIIPYSDTYKKFAAMSSVFKDIVKNKTFLEIGCDTGYFPLQAASFGACNAIGIDRYPKPLKKAERVRNILGLNNVEFKCQTIPHLEISNRSHTVLCLSFMHYMFSDKCGNEIIFSKMNSFIKYLTQFTEQYLLIEFVSPEDIYSKKLVADQILKSGEYSLDSFLLALRGEFTSVFDLGVTHYKTRNLYLACKNETPLILVNV